LLLIRIRPVSSAKLLATVGLFLALAGAAYAAFLAPAAVARNAYVVNYLSNSVSVIDTQTNTEVGAPITVGTGPIPIAITPDGARAYVANSGSNSVSVIDTATNEVAGAPIVVGNSPAAVAITPSGQTAYVANVGSNSVSVIDTATNQTVGGPITDGSEPEGIAITPDQPPHASFTDPSARGKAVSFSASRSSDSDGTIARYDWAFGDGKKALTAGPRVRHRYRAAGRYKVTLALTDNEGCSTHFVFSGQTASCNGSALASQTQALIEVSLRCPTSSKPSGCRFKLQALTKKRKGKAETALTKAKLKAGKSALVSLKPKRAFGGKLLTARNVLVKETATIKGQKRTLYRRLKSRGA
jgi:YVTN family beta-propeller protein